MSDPNKLLVRQYVEEILNKGDAALIDNIIALGFIGHDPTGPDIYGPKGVKQQQTLYLTAFPDLQYIVEEVIAENNIVVWRWTAHATHLGEILGIAATRKQVTITGTTTCHIANGKFEELWNDWDALGLLQQLQADPRPSSAAMRLSCAE